MKRITEKAWKRVAQIRIRKAIRNIEACRPENSGHECPVCAYMRDRGINPTGPVSKRCTDYWGEVECPARRSCLEFLYIVDDMFYPKSQLKRLKILLRSVGG